MSFLVNWLVKLTGWIPQLFVFRIKVYYEDKKIQGKRIKGGAIIASNHNSLMDFAVLMFVFWRRTLRCVVAEVMFKMNIFLSILLHGLGTIKVDRQAHEFSFIEKCKKILDKGGVVEIFPEARLPQKGETRPLEFKPSTVYLALESGAPIIPVYNDGKHFSKERSRVIIGTPIYVHQLYDSNLSQKENIEMLNNYLRERIIDLGKQLESKKSEEKRRAD